MASSRSPPAVKRSSATTRMPRAQAAREAVMDTGFGPIVNRFSTSAPNQRVIAGVLHEQCDVPESQSEKLADILIASATEAELIAGGRFDVAAIEQAMASVETIAVTSKPKKPATNGDGGPSRSSQRTTRRSRTLAVDQTPYRSEGGGPFGEISVVIQIDATKLSPSEIKDIVRELAQPATVT